VKLSGRVDVVRVDLDLIGQVGSRRRSQATERDPDPAT